MSAGTPAAAPAAPTAAEPTLEPPLDPKDAYPTVAGLPEAGNPGYVRLIDIMGDDDAVVAMARISYGDGTTRVRGTKGLLRYLMRHGHTSPFEGVIVKLEVMAPIYVGRQWMRHRTASYNEYSQRYSEAPDFPPYVPAEYEAQSAANRQGGAEKLPHAENLRLQGVTRIVTDKSRAVYGALLGSGVSREAARGVLPVAGWTKFVVVQNLHNLFHFLRLRLDAHAQREIRVYAQAILDLIAPRLPLCVQAFRDYQLDAVRLTRLEVEALRKVLRQRAQLGAAAAAADDEVFDDAPFPVDSKNRRERDEWTEKFRHLSGGFHADEEYWSQRLGEE